MASYLGLIICAAAAAILVPAAATEIYQRSQRRIDRARGRRRTDKLKP